MLLEVALPLSLAVIMLSLGVGLTFADFGRVLQMPKAVGVGLTIQILGLPSLAFLLLLIFPLPPGLAFGVMLLSFCPGGVTSNMLTKLSGGTVALSITLTAIASLVAILSVPLLVRWAAQAFLGEAAPPVDVTSIAIAMFLITAVPVLLGMLLRHFATGFADRIERALSILALVLFVVIIVAALAVNWELFINSIVVLGPLLVLFNIIAIVVGILVARLLGLDDGDAKSIAIELGVQNGTLGITVAGLLSASGELAEYAVPSAIYGVVMYAVTIPALFIMRGRFA